MQKVWRLIIGKNSLNQSTFGPIEEAEMDDEDFGKYKWDKIVRFDMIQSNAIIIVAHKKEMLEAFSAGLYLMYNIEEEWTKAFGEQKVVNSKFRIGKGK
jgi:hypothetical protein